jgi:hypothetical protein
MSTLHSWVETLEFDSGIMSRKLPVNALLGRIAPLFPLVGFLYERLSNWDPPLQAVQGQGTALALGAIEPTTMLGGRVDLPTRGEPSGLLWREGLREGATPMGLEVITDQTDTFSRRITGIQEVVHCRGPVHGRLVLSDLDGTPTRQRRCAHEEVGGTVPLVRLVVALGFPLFRWQRVLDFLHQRHELCLQAYPWDRWIVRPLVDRQDILHRRHQRATWLGRNDPHLPQMGWQRIFFRTGRTVSGLMASTIAKATA